MTHFTPLTTPTEADFFTIYTHNGKRYIHLHGYTYKSDDYWANMEACGAIVPLDEFIRDYRNEDAYNDTLYEQCEQYQGDYTETEIVELINHYYRDIVFSVDEPAKNDGMPDAWLGFAEVTMDTPDGNYIC
jgi:hypothetical protein